MKTGIIISFVALMFAIIGEILKNFSKEFHSLFSLAGTVFFVTVFLGFVSPVITYLNSLFGLTEFEDYFIVLFKAVGISFLISVVSEMCVDLGEEGIAKKAELCGKAALIYLSLPIMEKIFEYIKEFSNFQ